jgi:hypothetical protein
LTESSFDRKLFKKRSFDRMFFLKYFFSKIVSVPNFFVAARRRASDDNIQFSAMFQFFEI